MQTLAKQVLEHASRLPEGTPLAAKELLHLGSRAAVDQVLSRLVGRGTLLRAGRGIYVLPVESRFGTRAPSTVKMVEGLANQRGETIVSHGAAAANTQFPARPRPQTQPAIELRNRIVGHTKNGVCVTSD